MKKAFLSLILILSTLTAKADTIDVWHVYYNNIKIKEFNQYNKGKVKIDSKKYRSTDKIIVRHFDDTPCDNCTVSLFIERGKQEQIIKALGEGKPLEISVKNLMGFNKQLKTKIKVYYSSGNGNAVSERKLLFEIEIL